MQVSFLQSSMTINNPGRVTSFQLDSKHLAVRFHQANTWLEFHLLKKNHFLCPYHQWTPHSTSHTRSNPPWRTAAHAPDPACSWSLVWMGAMLVPAPTWHSAVSLPAAVGTSPSPSTGRLWGSVLLVAPISQLILRGNLTNPNMLCSYQLVDAGSVPHASLCNGAIIEYALLLRGTLWTAVNAAY